MHYLGAPKHGACPRSSQPSRSGPLRTAACLIPCRASRGSPHESLGVLPTDPCAAGSPKSRIISTGRLAVMGHRTSRGRNTARVVFCLFALVSVAGLSAAPPLVGLAEAQTTDCRFPAAGGRVSDNIHAGTGTIAWPDPGPAVATAQPEATHTYAIFSFVTYRQLSPLTSIYHR